MKNGFTYYLPQFNTHLNQIKINMNNINEPKTTNEKLNYFFKKPQNFINIPYNSYSSFNT